MLNLITAKNEIEAEITALQVRIVMLQRVLNALSEMPELNAKSQGKLSKEAVLAKRGPKPKVAAVAKATDKKVKKAVKVSKPSKVKQAGELPSTGGDYWPNLITDQPQSATDILNAAVNGLGFTPNKQQVQKLQQRATFALNALVKSGQINDSDKGRERRFFKG